MLSVVCFYCCDNGENDLQYTQNWQQNKPYKNKEKHNGNQNGHHHGDLKIHRFLALFVDKGMILFLKHPYDQWGYKKADPITKQSYQGNQMADHRPLPLS